MSKGQQPDDSAVNAQLAETQQQEYYEQQQAWQTVHSQIEEQGGLNWSTQAPMNAPASTPNPTPPHGSIANPAPSPEPMPSAKGIM